MPNKVVSFLLFVFLFSACQSTDKRRDQAENYHQMAISVLSKCNNRLSLSYLLKAIKLNPRDFQTRHSLALVYFSLEKYDLAANQLRKLLNRNPEVTEARVSLAQTYIKLNKYKQALAQIKKAEKDYTYNNPLKLMEIKALIDFNQGHLSEARKQFREIYTIPNSKNCFRSLYLARAEMKLGDIKVATNLLKKSIQLCTKENKNLVCEDQKKYDSHYFLAKAYIKSNDKKRAKYHLKIFLKKVKPNHPYFLETKKILKNL